MIKNKFPQMLYNLNNQVKILSFLAAHVQRTSRRVSNQSKKTVAI